MAQNVQTQPQAPLPKRGVWHKPLKWRRRYRLIAAGLIVLVFVVVLLGIFRFSGSTPLTLAMVTTSSGPQAWMGQEALNAVELKINEVNQEGGVNGHPIQLQVFDDKFDHDTAKQIAHKVAASSSLMVLGPIYSQMSVESNPIYKAAQIPLLTGTVSSDSLVQENPYAFRLRTPLSSQGVMSATYVRQVLGLSTATIVHATDSAFGQPTADAFKTPFVQQDGSIVQELSFDPKKYQSSDLDNIATTILKHDPNPQIIYIAALEPQTIDVVKALRGNGVKAPIFCTTSSSTAHFADSFPSEDFTNGVYAPAPVIFDSAPDEAQAFASSYQHTYGSRPGWPGAMFYESAQVAVAALSKAHVQGTPESVREDRERIANQLRTINSPQTSVEGINGPVYFGSDRNAVLPLRFGQFSHRRLHSLSIQLGQVSNPALFDQPSLEKAGEIIHAGDLLLLKQHVVYAGIYLNKVSSINVTTSTFTADCYLWMLFNGSDDATAITFTNASNVSFDPTAPLRKETIKGLDYRLYHVTGDFKAHYDFHQYPFDQQQLSISFQNTRLTNDRLVYAIDEEGLQLRSDNTPDPTAAAEALQALSSWTYLTTQHASDTFTSHSTLGDPRNFGQRAQTAFSGLQVTTVVQRKSLSYLTSHLLPLVLLFLLVYASLFLSHTEHLGDRLALVVAALLTSAVLLLSINSELPEIGYVVSLHYIYYVFFMLCFICIVVPMFMKWLEAQKHTRPLRWINIALHIFYLVFVAITVINVINAIYSTIII